MTNKHMKRSSTSLLIRQMQIKTTMRYHLMPVRMAASKKSTNNRSEEHTSELQSPSAVILEPKNLKSLTVFIVSPSIRHEVMGSDALILVFLMLSFKPTFL